MPSVIYNSFIQDVFNGDIDLGADTFEVMLTTAAYVPDKDNHSKRSHVTNEVTGAGYVSGGIALTGVSVTVDAANDRVLFDAADAVWPNSTIANARYAIVYKVQGANPATDRLCFAYDFGANASSVGAPFTIQWAALGLMVGQQA
jgi:hypothetical protein